MKAGTRLAAYGAGLVLAFGAAYGVAGVVVPDGLVAAWTKGSTMDAHDDGHGGTKPGGTPPPEGNATEDHAPDGHASEGQASGGHGPAGLSLAAGGFVLSPVEAPNAVGVEGTLGFRILDQHAKPVTEFATAHEKDLHLIVVRSDGTGFRHVHPVLDTSTGTWSMPWTWDEAGTHRVFADFTPTGEDADGVTLTRTVQVAGDFQPVATAVKTTDEVDGFTATIDGHLAVGESSELTISISQAGVPVTTLEPYLGAFGHLVALREGDLAYLHVHAEGAEPRPGDTAGPAIVFAAEAPTAGRYLLYLDFQVDGEVHTAEFVLDTEH